MTRKKVLVTGGAGFVAGFVVERLREQHTLTLLDRARPAQLSESVAYIQADVTDLDGVLPALRDQDVVVHLASIVRDQATRPLEDFVEVMVKGTWNVAEACATNGVGRLVNFSSILAAGWPEALDAPYRAKDPRRFTPDMFYYCLAKYLGEEIASAYHQAYGLSVVNLRPGVIARDGLNPEPELPEKYHRYWFRHVDPLDVAQAVEAAVEAEELPLGTFNVVAGREDSFFDWTEARDLLGYRPAHNWPEVRHGG